MPKATAVWLIENTSLTFEQIADFCGLHILEVKGIADGDVAQGIKGLDPVASGQLSRDEIEAAQADPSRNLTMTQHAEAGPAAAKHRRGPRYTPVSKRQERPDAIAWLVRNHPELSDAQVMKLVGTTKPTIKTIRERAHWNMANIKPVDPVTLGLCSQTDLDNAVQKAAERKVRDSSRSPRQAHDSPSLRPAAETTANLPPQSEAEEDRDEQRGEPTPESVFGQS
jgi:hypothetical protein